MSDPSRMDFVIHHAKVQVHRVLRAARDQRAPIPRARASRLLVDRPILAEDRCALWNRSADRREWPLERGKVENLRVAARLLDGLELAGDQVFSFWTQVGAPIRARGFVAGRELREGCIVPGIGGGLCLLSNALYAAAARAGFRILERHPHSKRPPGSRAALGEDATVAWNYVDLRFAADHPWRLEVRLDADELAVAIRGDRRRQGELVLVDRRGAGAAEWGGDAGRSCLSCDRPCHASVADRAPSRRGRRAWLVDAVWPEYASYLRRHARPDDRLVLAMDGQLLGRSRYAWPRTVVGSTVQFPARTVVRALRSRRLASQGAARQRALLAEDRRLAEAMARTLTVDDTELVVAQTLLPFLSRAGALGGREVTVLMQRLPLSELQATLDRAHATHPDSPTLGDFRADPRVVEDEAQALAGARRIVTPHAAVAGMFGERAVLLDWSSPTVARVPPAQRRDALRLWLPASTVGRKGARELRDALRDLGAPVELWIAGGELEGPNFWPFAVRRGSPPLAEIDGVVLPAWVEHEPRALLRALAAGVPVVASSACGLGDRSGVSTVEPGDVEGLRASLEGLWRTTPRRLDAVGRRWR